MDKFNGIDEAYRRACHDLIVEGKKVRGTKELENYCFQLTNLENNIINIRNISKSYLLGEMLWYATGRNDVAFIQHFANLWARISDDGVTSNSAYGHILFNRHGFNQVEKIIDLLKIDRDSRRAVLNFNVPNEKVIETNDEPCTICLDFLIRDNKLNCTCVMRSNDIWYGLPYDVAFFTELQKYIARRVGAEYGTYTHHAISLHVYERNYKDIEEVTDRKAETKISVNYEMLVKCKNLLVELLKTSIDWKSDIVKHCTNLKIISEENI